jgi:peptidoglycan-associated lipoprotein
MMRALVLLAAVLATAGATAAEAQRRGSIINRVLPRRAPPPPVLVGIDALRADFRLKTGGDTVYFAGDGAVLSAPVKAMLAVQAQWLRQHPEVVVQIEGHADLGDTRDHALAVGARRAEEVRQYLVLMGVPAAQLSAVSFGKERPGPGRAVTILVR